MGTHVDTINPGSGKDDFNLVVDTSIYKDMGIMSMWFSDVSKYSQMDWIY